MAIVATRLTATFAGLWTGLGAGLFEAWTKYYSLDASTHQIAFFIMLVPFFFVPGLLFVVGLPNVARASASNIGQMALRMVCLLLGASIAAMFVIPFVGWLHAS